MTDTMPTVPDLAVTGAQALTYLRAGRPYAGRTDESLRAEAAAPRLPMIHYEGDPSQLTGTVWARCELVLRSGDLVVPGPLAQHEKLATAG